MKEILIEDCLNVYDGFNITTIIENGNITGFIDVPLGEISLMEDQLHWKVEKPTPSGVG